MLNVKLVKIESTHANLRTGEIEGKTGKIPEPGACFMLFSKPLDPTKGDTRIIQTTPVQVAGYNMDTRCFRFKTENSTYDLFVLDEQDPFDFATYNNYWSGWSPDAAE